MPRLLLSGLGGLLALIVTPTLTPTFAQSLPVANLATESPQAILDQGRALYQQRRWTDAIATWQAALASPSIQADNWHQAAVWTYLGMAYHKLGEWSAATEAIATSLQILQTQPEPETAEQLHILAQTLNTQAQLDFALGRIDYALAHWQQTTQIYRDLEYSTGITGSLINQARALEASGYYRRACQTLLEAIDLDNQTCDFTNAASLEPVVQALNQQSNRDLQILGWRSLGNVLRLTGHLSQAQELLVQSVARAKELDNPYHLGFSLFSLGQVESDLYTQAAFRYEQTKHKQDLHATLALARQALTRYAETGTIAEAIMGDRLLTIQTNVQQLTLLVQLHTWLHNQQALSEVETLRPQLQTQLQAVLNLPVDDLPPSRTTIYSQINLAQSLITLWQSAILQNTPTPAVIRQRLIAAQQQAAILQDRQAESYALGMLGNLYEQQAYRNDSPALWQQAQQFTEAALTLAQAHQAWHIAYQWQWQLGRIDQALVKPEQAITRYQEAVETLQTVRQDLLAIESDVQFSFRDHVEPLYREWVALLVESPGESSPDQEHLQQAMQAIDALRLSELENFLSCNLTPTRELDQLQTDSQTAILYPIILPDQLVVILRSPHSESLQFHRVALSATEVEHTLGQLRQQLEKRYMSSAFFELSGQVYDWLIHPFESALAAQSIQTLVFVSDGALRNVPMAALHNGQNFLIEDYAIALSPGLQLPASAPLSQMQLGALTFGLSKIRQDFSPHYGFAPLPNVETEVAAIQTQVSSRTMLNQEFTSQSLRKLINTHSLPVVHLATHGQFSSNPENTFLLAWDQRITVDALSKMLQNQAEQSATAIELLVLSACKTAAGDNRATLGLAGVAIQSGARSTIASLWYIDDRSTAELMQRLYQELATLESGVPRAEALRRAQVDLLNTPGYHAPTYWAPYVLVGNWL
ncbi:MAG: CHAT domain-containing protein [Cyanothece sp. SIO1E1]|nr:CHAT domain-containing protein [Cyanothece sp. SIO1E1]